MQSESNTGTAFLLRKIACLWTPPNIPTGKNEDILQDLEKQKKRERSPRITDEARSRFCIMGNPILIFL